MRKNLKVFMPLAIVATLTVLFMLTVSMIMKHEDSNLIESTQKAVLSETSYALDYDTADTKEEIILATVCGGFYSTRQLYVLLKSILFYRSNKISLHILVDPISRVILEELFRTWTVSDLTVKYLNMYDYERQVSWVPNTHYSHRYGLMKLIFPSILASDDKLDRVILMDTDLLVLGDIAHIWRAPSQDDKESVFWLVENQSEWYRAKGRLSGEHRSWPALGRGFNSGIVLINLKNLRLICWDQIWRKVAEVELTYHLYATLADQDIFNAIFKSDPGLVRTLPCHFNLQLNDHTNSTKSCPSSSRFKVIHWNSPNKLQSSNPDSKRYLVWYRNFKNWSGKLLEEGTCCDQQSSQQPIHRSVDNFCEELRPNLSDRLRTFLYYLDYEISSEDDVTLVVHMSLDRLTVFEQLITHWQGPVSVAIYMFEAEVDYLEEFIRSSNATTRRNIGYHLVFRDEGLSYPINRLRNIALKHVQTPYVFLSDVDFLPSFNLKAYLSKVILDLSRTNSTSPLHKRALVVPAFENSQYKFDYPADKSELLRQLDQGVVTKFRDQIWPKGQTSTNYERWRSAVQPYRVDWMPDYEPFVVTNRNVLHFDENFAGFGWNKVEHTTLLAANNYEFLVLPDVFIIHKSHPASYDILRHRDSPKYRSCINSLKRSFLIRLKNEHPEFFANYSRIPVN